MSYTILKQCAKKPVTIKRVISSLLIYRKAVSKKEPISFEKVTLVSKDKQKII